MFLEVEVIDKAWYTLCRPVGEVDGYTIHIFNEALSLLRRVDNGVLFDLSRVPFMDSYGIGSLVKAIRQLRESEVPFAAACSQSGLRELFSRSRLDRLIFVGASIEEAETELRAHMDDRTQRRRTGYGAPRRISRSDRSGSSGAR